MLVNSYDTKTTRLRKVATLNIYSLNKQGRTRLFDLCKERIKRKNKEKIK